MSYPKTRDEWWALVDRHWQNFMECFANAGAPMSYDESGHWWSDGIGKDVTRHQFSLPRTLYDAKSTRDAAALYRLLSLCWMAAPDIPEIHQWPSWDALCDACSEYPPIFEPELNG